jgi:AraC-like DNA-binding protein
MGNSLELIFCYNRGCWRRIIVFFRHHCEGMFPSLESRLAYLNFQLVTPSPVLRPYIRSYWYIKPTNTLTTFHEEFMHPTGGYGVVFNLGDRVQLDGQPVAEPVFLDGANTISRKMGFSGQNKVIGIRFLEGGAYPFLGLPLNELRNEKSLLDALKEPSLLILQARLQETSGLPERIKLLEGWLLGRLAVGIERSPLIPASFRLIRKNGRSVSIPDLAEQLGIGQRQLERLYKSQVGMSPKQYLQLLRVDLARQVLRRGEENTTTAIGMNLGYYDQSHFIHEFQAVVGMTPYAYQRRKQED